eukprot:7094-Pyramimonas_sp.AAC.1
MARRPRAGEVPCEDDSDEDDETIRKHLHNSMVIHVEDLDNVPDLADEADESSSDTTVKAGYLGVGRGGDSRAR